MAHPPPPASGLNSSSLTKKSFHVRVFVSAVRAIPEKGARCAYLVHIQWCVEFLTQALKPNNAHVFSCWDGSIANQAAWERGSKIENSRKWLRECAKDHLDPGSEEPLALVQTGVAPVQNRFRKVQATLGRPLLPGSK